MTPPTPLDDADVEAVARAIYVTMMFSGPISDKFWQEKWVWCTAPETVSQIGIWEPIRYARAALTAAQERGYWKR